MFLMHVLHAYVSDTKLQIHLALVWALCTTHAMLAFAENTPLELGYNL